MPVSIASNNTTLFCPECAISLNEEAGQVICSQCKMAWDVIDGIPHFIRDFAYWGEISQQQMQTVNRAARQGNWKSALLDSPDPAVRSASQMMLNLERANWHWLAGIRPEGRVLDLGAGTGTISHALGMYYREVIAVEPVLERVEFMRQRFTQEGLSNIKVLRSSLWTLPFAPASFDLVAMNGVLEWVPLGSDEDPREVQLQALRNAYHLLKPGGCLYVGIENRTATGYFLGYPDPHCGLPWVTILPRPLAHWYARKKGAPGYRNYLYTSRGYRKLLHEAGFSRLELYVAVPSYNQPRFIIPLEEDLFSYYSRSFDVAGPNRLRGAIRRVLSGLNLLQHMQYSYVILARK